MDNRSVVPLVPYGREYSLEVTQAELKQLGADSTNTFEKVVDSVKGTLRIASFRLLLTRIS
ncbi:hypothetical protein [Schleiferilactobacillus harbinensis]|uniref:hypothetical protein n=1 Tax=Schleiferilactobacillus harbinensis TaxID=304207 RepID=UPI0039E99D2A